MQIDERPSEEILVFTFYQGFTASAEGYPYKILDHLSGTLLISPSITDSRSFG
jgi:hypothetical protein